MKELKIIELKLPWPEELSEFTENKLVYLRVRQLKDLLYKQAQLTREQTIKDCMEVGQTESGLANRDYCTTSHAKESLQKLLKQDNNE